MKKIIKNSFLVLIITIVLLFIMLRKDYKTIISAIVDSNKLYLLLALLFYFISFFIDSFSFHMIIRNYTKNYSYSNTLKLNMMTKFFNGVTPLSTGGQPLQIYELYKNKVKLDDSTNIVVQFFIIYQIAVVIFSTIAVILNYIFHIFAKDLFVRKLVVLGYIINIVVLLVLFLISFNKDFNFKIIGFGINILSKLKIVKNKEKTMEKWEKKCNNFYESAMVLKKNPRVLIYGTTLQIVQLLFLYSVPFFLAKSIVSDLNLTYINSVVSSTYVNLIGSYIIVPGASGGIEYGFIKLFSNFFKEPFILSVTILWRFVTYYLPLILGGILFNIKKKDILPNVLDKE